MLGTGTVSASKADQIIAQAQQVVKIDGSSTVFPITNAIAQEFKKTNNPVQVNVGISGTTGGFKKFCAGETDISNASRPILQAEMVACDQNKVRYFSYKQKW